MKETEKDLIEQLLAIKEEEVEALKDEVSTLHKALAFSVMWFAAIVGILAYACGG